MRTSTDRILTTHAGSIPRGEPLGQMLIDEEAGKPVDNSALESNIGSRVSHVLEKQAEAGIDIINDGEQGRVGFQTYVTQRMSGFGGVSKRRYGKEFIEYPQFTKRMMERLGKISKVFDAPQATADIKYRDTALINAEIERLTRLSAAVKPRVTEFFMNAPSPGIVATTMLNAHYASHEAYLAAVRDPDRISRRDQGGFRAANRRARAGDGTSAAVPGHVGHGIRQAGRAACRGSEQSARRHPGRPRAAACLLGKLGRASRPRCGNGGHLAGALPGECERAQPRIRQSAPSTRIGGVAQIQAARQTDPDRRRDRSEEQHRRTSRGGCSTHRNGGSRGWRPRTRDCWRRLRLWHFRRLGMGHRGCGVGQTGDIARRSRNRLETAMGQEGGLSPPAHPH